MSKLSDWSLLNEYLAYLCDRYGLVGADLDYTLLASALADIEFYSLVKFDINREEDGVNLRRAFLRSINEDPSAYPIMHYPCSVLEMMCALSDRMYLMLFDSSNESVDPGYWLHLLFGNLGLSQLDDSSFFISGGLDVVASVISNLLERTYNADGSGGLFPLRHPTSDQRDVDIWKQANFYAHEILSNEFENV